MPSPLGWLLIGAGTLVAVGLSRVLALPDFSRPKLPALPAPASSPIYPIREPVVLE